MFNTTILDVAMGMVFIYLLLSLLCSAANEMIELILKKRATYLERGIRELLEPGTKSGADGLVKNLYSHPLINSLFAGTYEQSGIASTLRYLKGTDLPSYIPARNFALALMDLVAPSTVPAEQSGAAGATVPPGATVPAGSPDLRADQLRAKVQQLENTQVRTALTTLIDAAGDDAVRVRMNIEDWFNSSMDRVSGWYKRRSHTILLVLGLLVAILVNADSVLIVRRLASDRPLRESLVAASIAYAQQNAGRQPSTTDCCAPGSTPSPTPNAAAAAVPCASDECKGHEDTPQCKLKTTYCQIAGLGLPIGWSSETPVRSWRTLGQKVEDHILGWILTALAVSLGAPFWFDLLNKFIVIRSTVKPKEKSPEEKSKD